MAAVALSTVLDSGAPDGHMEYITIVLIHGLMWQGTNFKKLLPLASGNGIRIIAANRRDYPGSRPYTPQERAQLERLAATSPDSADARAEAANFMRDRGREVYDYLADLVKREAIPPLRAGSDDAHTKLKGGIVLVGWSLGTVSMTTLLAHAPSFQSDSDVQLSKWVRRVVLYEPTSMMLGQPSPAGAYYPPHDESIPFAERTEALHQWLTRYYQHGEPVAANTLDFREGLREPSSTLDRMSEDELAESVYGEPGDLLSGSDTLTVKMCYVHDLYLPLKDGAVYLPPAQDENGTDGWRDVEIRLMWCDQSLWSMVWGQLLFAEELKEVRAAGKSTRKVSFVRLRGANHYAHWDFPEKTLRAFIGDDEEL